MINNERKEVNSEREEERHQYGFCLATAVEEEPLENTQQSNSSTTKNIHTIRGPLH